MALLETVSSEEASKGNQLEERSPLLGRLLPGSPRSSGPLEKRNVGGNAPADGDSGSGRRLDDEPGAGRRPVGGDVGLAVAVEVARDGNVAADSPRHGSRPATRVDDVPGAR